MTCNVTGTAISPNGQIKPGAKITFRRAQLDVVSQSGSFVIPDDYIIQTALDGTVDFDILPGVYDATTVAVGGRTVAFRVSVPDEPAADFADLLNASYVEIPPASVTQSQQARDAAIAARDVAVAARDEALLYDGPKVDTFVELASVTPAQLAVGEYIRVIATGAVYQRVSTGGDLDYSGSGGVLLAEAGTSYTTRQRFVQAIARGELSGLINGTTVTAGGLEFVRASGATAISDLPGWLPQGLPDYRHYATVAEFNAATGNAYPSPYMTRYDLPPTEIDIMASGVVPSNSAAHADNNVGAIQDMIDWLTSKTNGGTISGGGFGAGWSNPIITINAPLMMKPKVHFNFDRSVRFRATAAMTSMVETAVGAPNRLRGQSILGGTWDAGRLADSCFRLRDFEDVNFGGPNMELRAAARSPLSVGDAAQSANSFGLYFDGVKIINSNVAYGAGAVAGVEFVNGISDSRFANSLIVGYPRGFAGELYISRMNGNHVWSYPDTQGPCEVGFDIGGGNNVYVACQVDNPYEAAYRISGGDNYRFIGCTSTFAFEDISDPGAPGDLTVYMFDNPANASNLSMIDCYGNDRAATRFAGLIQTTKSTFSMAGNSLRYGPQPKALLPRLTRFDPANVPDYIGQIATAGGRSYVAVSTTEWRQIAQASYSLAYAASVTPDRKSGHVRVGNLTGNITINAPSETPTGGDRLTFSFVQDATGGRTISWASVYLGGPTGGGPANGRLSVTFVYDGFRYVAENGAWV